MRVVMQRSWQRLWRVRASRLVLVAAVVALAGGVAASVPVPWPAFVAWVGGVLLAWGLPGLVTLGAAGVLVVLAVLRGRARVRERGKRTAAGWGPVRPIPGWAIWVGLVLVLSVGTLTAWGLVTAFGSGSPQDKAHLEAIKLAGSIAVGTGGAVALLLAARRQRATEVGLLQQEQRDASARHDADERRVTELYTAAANQLASDKAPVRLAGLYALERLGQNNPNHRQTIVNLLCAYLRMPYTHPDTEESAGVVTKRTNRPGELQQGGTAQPLLLDLAPTLAEAAGLSLDATDQQQQELKVRLAAQQILTHHLRADFDEYDQPTNPAFWSGMDLDLAGANLYHWECIGCCVYRADFTGARFYDEAVFVGAHFYGSALFIEAQFHDSAVFNEAYFHETATFLKAYFHDVAWFDEARFHASTGFVRTQFRSQATFDGVQFSDQTKFDRVWARLDSELPRGSSWPTGYTVREADPGDGRVGRWGRLVPTEEMASAEKDGGATAETDVTASDTSGSTPHT